MLTDWREVARCKQMDPDLFFPVGTTGPALLQIEAAKAVCRGCSVKEQCLQYAIESNQEYGIWGATTEEERRYMRRELTSRV
jgi:WhiB family transcriptional regulator, redox-sensing transcriptional regulator